MARLRIKNLRQLDSEVRKRVVKRLRDKEFRQSIGAKVVAGIKDTTYGIASKFTQEIRSQLERYNRTDPKYKRKKINITFTGELLNDLINNVKFSGKRGKVSYEIEHTNKKHTPYKRPNKKKGGTFGVAKYQDTRFDKKSGGFKTISRKVKVPYKFISIQIRKRLGYNYFDVSKRTKKSLIKMIRKEIIRGFKKGFFR